MKVLAILSLCAFAAVQGRSAVVSSNRSAAALGDNPWLLHLRVAVSTSGLLNSCAGSLINERWALTTTACVADARFIWIRYGVVNVINPSLVTEASIVISHPTDDVSVVNINRAVEFTSNIASVLLSSSDLIPASASLCAFGDDGADGPGETLYCQNVTLTTTDGLITATSEDGSDVATSYDIGAPLVSEGTQYGLLSSAAGDIISTAPYISWIEEETGISLSE